MAMARSLIRRASVAAVAACIAFGSVSGAAVAQEGGGPAAAPERVSIDFEQAAIPVVVRFYAELLDRNFVLGPDLADVRITILAPRPVTPAQAWDAFVAALAQRGLQVYREGEFYRIARVRGDAAPPGARRYALRYARSADVAAVLTDLAGADASVVAWPRTNAIIVVGAPGAADRLLRVARALDQPGAARSVHVVPLQHADANALAQTLRAILDD